MYKVYLVGYIDEKEYKKLTQKRKEEDRYPGKWEVVGIFDDHEKALDACQNPFCFVIDFEINHISLITNLDPPRGFYPLWDDLYEYQKDKEKYISKRQEKIGVNN
jgi:hypothetical protein